MSGWRTEWWELALREMANGGLDRRGMDYWAVAAREIVDYLDAEEQAPPEHMTFDEWCTHVSALPCLYVDDVEEILSQPYPTIGLRLQRWLNEAKAKT